MKKLQSLTTDFLKDYAFWLKNNPKIAQKIDKIIENIDSNGLSAAKRRRPRVLPVVIY